MAANYSIDTSKDMHKLGFTVGLNIAYDNCVNKTALAILKEMHFSKRGIAKSDTGFDKTLKPIATSASERLYHLRNYFSHYYHDKDNALVFNNDDNVKVFMEDAYKEALGVCRAKIADDEYKGVEPPLFESAGDKSKITTAGVVFFASFFCHRQTVNRMFGGVSGLKRSGKDVMDDGRTVDFNFTRKLLSFYSLRDSYSIKNDETEAFRNVLGYLSRFPKSGIDFLEAREELTADEKKRFSRDDKDDSEGNSDGQKKWSMRHTDKFMLFAMRFIEEWSGGNKYKIEFGRYIIEKDDTPDKKQEGKQRRKVRFISEESSAKDWPYYIRNNHAIVRVKLKGKEAVSARISENELKYFVLAIFDEQGGEAIERVANHIYKTKGQIKHRSNGDYKLPSFVGRTEARVSEAQIDSRVQYITGKMETAIEQIEAEQETKEWVIYKGSKIAMILKFVANSIEDVSKRPDVKEYDALRDCLQGLDFAGFYSKLRSYVADGRLDNGTFEELNDTKNISELCKRTCQLTCDWIEKLKKNRIKLLKYIGLEPECRDEHYEKGKKYEVKAEHFLKSQLSISKNFLRRELYGKYCQAQSKVDGEGNKNSSVSRRKSLVDIIRERLNGVAPLFGDKFYLMDKDPRGFDKAEGKVIRQLCGVYCKDILCMKMARWWYEKLSDKIDIKWETGNSNNGPVGYRDMKLVYDCECGTEIEFGPADFTRLDIISNPEMLRNVCGIFMRNRGRVTWHDFGQKGLVLYRRRQAGTVRSVFEFEKSLKIGRDDWDENNRMSFKGILEYAVSDGIMKEENKEAIGRVRNDFFHEEFKARSEEWKQFRKIMPEPENGWDNEKKDRKKRGRSRKR